MADIDVQTTFSGVDWSRLGAGQLQRLSAAVSQAAFGIERAAKVSIETGPKTGRVYPSKLNPRKMHQASAPGEAPATDTGTLVNSIQTRKRTTYEYWVTVGAEYGAGLEFGRVRVAPRPFMRPAAKKIEPRFLAACQRAILGQGGWR